MALRVISVTYGHSGSGKLYDYETDKQYRAGDVVVVPVTHWKSKKEYNTLATVELTSNADSSKGQQKLGALDNKGIEPKNTSMRLEIAKRSGLNVDSDRQVNITTLPGYQTRQSNESWGGSTTRFISRGG